MKPRITRTFDYDPDSITSMNFVVRNIGALRDALCTRIVKLREEQARLKAAAAPKPLGNILTLAVPSSSRPGLYHALTIDRDSKMSCSCEGFAFRGTCRHTDSYYRSGKYYDTVMTAIFRSAED